MTLAAALVFLPTLRFGFVYDDEEQIVGNPCIKSLALLPRAFTENVWAFLNVATNSYRPLHTVANTLLYAAWELRPAAYHAANVLFYIAASWLVVLLACRHLGSPRAGLAAGLLFALHPAHAEAVAWCASLPDLLAALFTLAAVLLCTASGFVPATCAVLATAGALLSKETGLATPVLVALEILWACGGRRRWAARRIAPHAALVPIYFLARLHALGGMTPLTAGSLAPLDALGAILARVGTDALRLLSPVGFSALTPFRLPSSLLDARVLAGALVLAAAAAALIWAYRRRSPAFLGIAWVLLPLGPTLYLPIIGQQEAVTDRYLYSPSVGFVLLAAGVLHAPALRRRAVAIAGRSLALSSLALVLVASAYAVSTARLLPPWRDSMALYEAVLARAPDATYIRLRRGLTYQRAGDLERARADYEEAIRREPDCLDAWLNLGVVHRAQGRLPEAVFALEKSAALARAERNPRRIADALVDLGETARIRNEPASAESLFLEAIRVDPRHPLAHNNLGVLYASALGRADLALRELEAAVAADPWNARTRENLGSFHASMGRWDEAARSFGEAVRIAPSSAQAWARLGACLERLGRSDEAAAAYRRAARLKPGD